MASEPTGGAAPQRVKRVAKIVCGFTLLAFGTAMLALPGPGWLTIVFGLAILAGEFVWAKCLLDRVKAGARKAQNAMRGNDKPD